MYFITIEEKEFEYCYITRHHYPNLLLWASFPVQQWYYQHQQQCIQLLWQNIPCTQDLVASMPTALAQQSCSALLQILILCCSRHGNPTAFLAVAPQGWHPIKHQAKERKWKLLWSYQEQQKGLSMVKHTIMYMKRSEITSNGVLFIVNYMYCCQVLQCTKSNETTELDQSITDGKNLLASFI